MRVTQETFIDGLDFISKDTQISPNGYYYLVNARQRLGSIQPNKKPLRISGIPSGNKQGIIAVGDILIAFVDGSAYYNVDGQTTWIKISNFTLDANVEKLYSIAVPAGTVAYVRKLNSSLNAADPIVKTYTLTVNGTPSAILVQDGINQPQLILENGLGGFTARAAQTYTQWANNALSREYVPIGTQMFIVDAKLFVVNPSKHAIYHSISGRYLDFMVNIDVNGDKLATESLGGADSVSFNFDADEITCCQAVGIPSSFVYGTARVTRIITLDYNNPILGEPQPYVSEIVVTGLVNEDSFVDILGDYACIDFEGVKSFNAVKTFKFEGRNSIFSLMLSRLLETTTSSGVKKTIKQTRCRAIVFNNYALFNLDTTWSNLLVIYDTILQKWVALDITKVNAIKQFAIVETEEQSKLYAINVLDELYQLYGSTENETGQLHTRAFANVVQSQEGIEKVVSKGEYFKPSFEDGSENAVVRLVEMANGEYSQQVLQNLPENLAGIQFPFQFPIIFNNRPRAETLTFNLARAGLKGNKLSYVVQWNTDAKLCGFELMTRDEDAPVSKEQMERTYAS